MNINQNMVKLGISGVCGKMGRRIFELASLINV